MAAFKHNYAIICRIPQSFRDRSVGGQGKLMDVEKAKREYEQFKATLKNCDINIIELQEDENYPDCCFVEDCAVTIGGTALIARPVASRQGEIQIILKFHPQTKAVVGEIRKVLRDDLGLKVVEIADPKATLEGGDVLFTGKEILVGIGKRTNEGGAQAVVDAFPEYPVTPINIGDLDIMHLKNAINVAGRDILAICGGKEGKSIRAQMEQLAEYRCKLLHLETPVSVDMLYINGRLLHRTRDEMGDSNYGCIDEKILYTRHRVSLEELSKAGGRIASLVLLVSKHRAQKKIISNLTEDDIAPFSQFKDLTYATNTLTKK